MMRVLLSLALVALVTTSAAAKPKIAILGLEVTGAVDQAATNVARDLTEGMRARAKVGSGPYTLAPNSDRELIDEKVIKQCDTEAPTCMSEIGKDIDTELLVYGKVEKDGGGFQATIVMLDVSKKTTIKTTFVAVPPGASSEAVRSIAKKTYVELAPSAASGTAKLVITANVESGSVFVDDELRETLADGRATLTLPEGRYRIAVESEGYKRKELTVKLTEDDRATEEFKLTKQGKGGGGGGIDPWKPVFGVSLAASVGLVVYSWIKSSDMKDKAIGLQGTRIGGDMGPIDQGDCGDQVMTTTPELFRETCSLYDKHLYSAIAAGGFGALVLVSGYMAFVRSHKEPAASTSARRTHKPSIALTPTLSPEGAGATLRIDW